jgi:glycosyltransferase involved in cell wall biosynthesis
VLIPAHNEEDLLPRCLRSVDRARRCLPACVTSDLIVVVDDSSDDTYAIARKMTGDYGCAAQIEARCVGSAREYAARLALGRYEGDTSACWLANTDADCEVPENWLVQHLEGAGMGWSAVAGIVDVDSFAEHAKYVEQRFREAYLIHPDGTHPHIHGANLGVRADVYLEVGGWGALHSAEDHHLWNRLRSEDNLMRSDARLIVFTSGRRVGRAPRGFAGALAAHNQVAA